MILPGCLLRLDPRLRQKHYALNELDCKLAKYLDHDGGFFVEAGANDGVAQSNTLYFERYRAWNGLLVEPVPTLARRARSVRTRSLTVNTALGSFEQRGKLVEMTYCNLMSIIDGAMTTTADQNNHIQVGSEVQNVKPYRLTVPCTPLSDLIDRYQIGDVDLLSLDVEGYEANVLKGIDFSRHRPRFMLIEARYRAAIEDVILPHYEVVDELSDHDVLYASRVTPPVLRTWGWNFTIERALTNAAALAVLHRR
jgi:FkbM family methyltransferase